MERSESQGQRERKEIKEKEMITEKMEGGIVVRRYKGEKVDVERVSKENRSITMENSVSVNEVVSESKSEDRKAEERAP